MQLILEINVANLTNVQISVITYNIITNVLILTFLTLILCRKC